ncbi:substrate-binding domain-containing protein [Kitasatospora arboriphila]
MRGGAEADLLVLADDALAKLAAEGHLVPGTVRPLWVSQVVAAVPEGSPVPALDSVSDLRAALLAAERIAYSTGPSGTALVGLVARLGLADRVDRGSSRRRRGCRSAACSLRARRNWPSSSTVS